MQRDTPAGKRGAVTLGGRCPPPCGKVRYYTRHQARAEARKARGHTGRLSAYRCGDFWHLTSQTAARKTHFREQDHER